jgi:hypothetical protein
MADQEDVEVCISNMLGRAAEKVRKALPFKM